MALILPATTKGPALRDRLFRPNRWRLWVQFALLGAFVVIIPILLTSYELLAVGRQVLVEHEIIDLSDECNLRVTEMREDMAFLARDVRRAIAAAQPGSTEELLVHLREQVQPKPASFQLPVAPQNVREARQKFMPGTIRGFAVFRAAAAGGIELLGYQPGPDHAHRHPSAGEMLCLHEVAQRGARRQAVYNSSLHAEPEPDGAPRCYLAIGDVVPGAEPRDRPTLAAVLVDFTRYIDNRRRISPRHTYIVVDPTGTLLVHPDPMVAIGQARLPDLIPWDYPQDENGASWFTPLPDPKARDRRLGQAVASGGARLPMIPVPALAADYRKGYFGKPIGQVLGAEAALELRRLNQQLREETQQDPLLRCGEVIAAFEYVEMAHPDPKKLERVARLLSDWYAAHTAGQTMRWTPAIPCRTFQGQLTPLRVDLNDEDPPSWLIVAASKEELQEDIDQRFREVQYRWVLPTLAISCLLAIGLVMTLTWSLARLARAARKLRADSDEIPRIPLGGPYEVSLLAHALADMTARIQERDRELRDRAARYETILRAAGEGIIITSANGVVEEANKAAGRMFGMSAEELIGQPVTALISHPDALLAMDSDHEPPGFSRSLDTIQGIRKDGTRFWLEVSLKPIPLRDRLVVTCVFRDISQRKEAEERIRRMNDDLENRVKQRTAELVEAKGHLEVALKQAEAASRAKDTFVANMSHELRQPLHIIIGFAEALKEEAAELGAETILPDLNKILAAAKHLLDLINDILDLAKISAGRMDLTLSRFELPKLVEDVRTLVAPLAEKNKNAFVVDAPADLGPMIADERRVRQILINLLSNAFKFTQNGVVTLVVRKVNEGGRPWVRFTIRDSGQGMSPEQVERLFQRFYQADSSTTRGQGGTGLGLAITQSFTELMNGQPIRVNSRVGSGSEFLVTLPVEVQPPGAVKPPRLSASAVVPALGPPARPPGTGRTVLVIDDDPMVRELMARFLQKDHFRVVQAAGGEEGFRLAREEQPNVITLDVMMPGQDGWAVLTRLKADPDTCNIPVVMLTIVDDRGRGFALGATEYLTKPIDWQRLGSILKRHLAGRSHRVLVIDDQDDNREVIRRFLERSDCEVIEAVNGEEGLRLFAEQAPSLVLLDLMMPVLDGFGFLDELARRFPDRPVPVLILTAKELTTADFDRLNGRVAQILAKGDLSQLDKLIEIIRQQAAAEESTHAENPDRR